MAELREVIPFQYRIIERSPKRKGVLMSVEGKLQQVDKKNENGRVYPEKVFDNILADERINERISSRGMVGTLGHPASGTTEEEKISHVVTEHYKKPNGEIWGKIDVLNTPKGQIASTLFEANVRLGASSRGDGSTIREGDGEIVQEDFGLDTYDLVINPSTSNAYPQICESVDQNKINDQNIINALNRLVESTTDKDLLLECNRIVSTLGGSTNSLTEKVIHKVAKLEERKDKNQDPNSSDPNDKITENKKENRVMPEEKKNTLFESTEVINHIDEQVKAKIQKQIQEKESKESNLNAKIVKLSEEKENLTKRLNAAIELIEGFQFKVKELNENKNTDTVTKKRLGAAEKIIEASVKKIKKLNMAEKRLGAAKQLLAASLDKHKNVAVETYVDKALAKLPESIKPKFKKVLSECKTPQQVNETLLGIKGIVKGIKENKKYTREPLPGRGNRKRIMESRRKPTVSDPVTKSLMESFGGR